VSRNYYGNDWIDRQVMPDVYPRKSDPFVTPTYETPPTGTNEPAGPSEGMAQNLFQDAITVPGVRPVVYQRALNITIPVTDQPIAIQSGTFQCDAIMVDVPSSSGNSTFFGFGSGISSTNGGIEVVPGVPQFFSPSNVREQWELQRLLEAITSMLGFLISVQLGGGPGTNPGTPGTFMSPRVVMNAHDYYLVNAATITQNVNVMLFTVPEMQ
jgi:hypothetical protein